MNKRLISYAAHLFQVAPESITDTHQRDRTIVAVRSALAWALLRAHPNWTQQEIATSIGICDRKSIAQGEARAERLAQADRSYRNKLDLLLLVAGRSEELAPAPPLQRQRAQRVAVQPDAMAIWMVQARGGIAVRTA